MYKFILFVFLFSSSCFSKSIELIARADSFLSYRLPMVSYLSNATVKQNNVGDVAFTFITIVEGEVRLCIWHSPKNSSEGQIIHMALPGNVLSDPSINDQGDIVFSEYNDRSVEAIYKYQISNSSLDKFFVPKEYISARDPKVNSYGDILFRASGLTNNKDILLLKKNEFSKIASMGNPLYSYLFTANFNGDNSIVLKTRLGVQGQYEEARPDQVRRINFFNESNVLIEDTDSNADSTFKKFNNTIGSSHNSLNFTFIANSTDGKKSLFRSVDGKIEKILSEGDFGIRTLEYFAPSINSKGNVAFRAISNDLKRSVFWTNGKIVKKYISKGDLIDSDITTAMIYAPKGPSFAGGISLNELDQVVFTARISTKNNEKDLGSAVLKVSF